MAMMEKLSVGKQEEEVYGWTAERGKPYMDNSTIRATMIHPLYLGSTRNVFCAEPELLAPGGISHKRNRAERLRGHYNKGADDRKHPGEDRKRRF